MDVKKINIAKFGELSNTDTESEGEEGRFSTNLVSGTSDEAAARVSEQHARAGFSLALWLDPDSVVKSARLKQRLLLREAERAK